MNPRKLFEIFTEALNDERIKAELTELIADKAAENMLEGQTELFPQNDTTALSAENAALSRKIALLELEAGRLRTENAELTGRLKRCQDSLDSYCSSYAMQISLYEKYKTLSDDCARVMQGIFKNNTLNGIFLCGVLPDNLKSLRDYTEQLVLNRYDDSRADIAVLCELYSYLLSCYNSTFSRPVYRITEVKPGDEFCEELHRSTGTSRQGRIGRVLLQGCIAAANGKVIRKAIVSL
ncbi:MAG: hypothetical protein MSJ26_03945 [Oscillospiraceae bacterium]|nr:hypothetical protein [Oscillospiraceae bacterium]